MKKLFSIFCALMLMASVSGYAATVNVTINVTTIGGTNGGSVTGTYYNSSGNSTPLNAVTSSQIVKHYKSSSGTAKKVALTPTANDGYRFLYFIMDGTKYTTFNVGIKANKTITAYFVKDPYKFDWTTDKQMHSGSTAGLGSLYTYYDELIYQVTLNKGYETNGTFVTNAPAITLYFYLYDYSYNNKHPLLSMFPVNGEYNVETDYNKFFDNSKYSGSGQILAQSVNADGNWYQVDTDGDGYNDYNIQDAWYLWNDDLTGTYATYSGTNTPKSKMWERSITDGSTILTSGKVQVDWGRHGYPYMCTTSPLNSIYNFEVGESMNLTTTYTSAKIYTEESNKKVVISTSDGNGNHMELIFPNLTSLDEQIGVPDGTYTIGTDVYGSIYDDDDYAQWKLGTGSIIIQQDGSKIAIPSFVSTAEGGWELNLSLSKCTPTKTTMTNVPIANATVNKYNGYFNVIGSASTTSVRVESGGVDYRTGYFGNYDIDRSYGSDIGAQYTNFRYNGSNISLDYNRTHAIITEISGNTFMEAYLMSTSGTLYRVAAFQGAPYTITYKDKGDVTFTGTLGSGCPTTHTYGTATNLVSPTKPNSDFEGWYETSACNGTAITSIGATAKTGNFTLYAKWSSTAVDVTLDPNDGTTGNEQTVSATNGNAMPTTLKAGGSIVKPTFSGYDFGGYVANSDGTGKPYYTAALASANNWDKTVATNIYAKWTQTITLNQNGATTEGTTSVTATYNGTIGSIANNPAKTGYDFGGWYADNDASGSQIINTSGELQSNVTNWTSATGKWIHAGTSTLYAKWTQTVTLNQNGATTNGTASVTATYNGTIGSIANNPSKTGYDFGGWCDASGSLIINTSGELQSNVTNWTSATGKWIHAGTSTLYAKWTQVVTLDKNGGSANGTVTVTYNANTTASFSAVTGVPEGYSALEGYYDAATGGNKIFNADGSLVTGSAVAGLIDASGNWIHTGAAPSIYAQFTPNTNTNYTVKHWQQNIADDNYTEVVADRQTLQGTTATPTAATAKTYTGFAAQTITQGTIAGDGSTVVNIYYNRDTYTVNLAVSPAGYGSVSPSAAITGVRYGTIITTGTGENANKVTINETVVTANPAATTAEYTYTFDNWINGTATVTGSGLTVTANFTRSVRTYDITFKNADGTTLKKSDGTTNAVYSVAYGETPAYDGATPTKDANSEYTYTFNGWDNEIVAVTTAATYTATYSTTKVQYTLAWDVNGGNALTGTYTNGTINWGTAITKPADPTKAGYTFNGWDANNDGTADDVTATMPTNDITYKALWTAASPNITLCENCNDDHYNTFKATYGGSAGVGVNVTYPRQFAEGRWSTMCLPFSLNLATMKTNQMDGCVYEFKYATGNANVGSGVNLYFSNAKSIEAGKCYIVNANSTLAEKTSFVFSGVTIDLSNDTVATLTSVGDYNKLPGYKSEGTTIELVGTLRNGTLQGSATGNTYMGLKENKIYYPNTTAPGSTIWAYRGIFRSSEILDKESMQKMRIIVDGEDRGELIIDADGDILAPSDAQSRKFIRDGVLYIEREGVIYDAQGKRVAGM